MNKFEDGVSKTSTISTYYINDKDNKFNIRIIDTPGFGDTKGMRTDDEVTKQFEELFNNIPEINYILLTVKASDTRLRSSSKYIYDRVQQLFGNDAKNRFLLMCTFSDENQPSCLNVISSTIHFEEYFTFNNSALFIPSDKGKSTTKFYWEMAMKSVKKFIDFVINKN